MRIVKVFDRVIWGEPSKFDGARPAWPDEVRKAIVYYHADWKAYFVRFWLNDECLHKATYPADDRHDVIARAESFIYKE